MGDEFQTQNLDYLENHTSSSAQYEVSFGEQRPLSFSDRVDIDDIDAAHLESTPSRPESAETRTSVEVAYELTMTAREIDDIATSITKMRLRTFTTDEEQGVSHVISR